MTQLKFTNCKRKEESKDFFDLAREIWLDKIDFVEKWKSQYIVQSAEYVSLSELQAYYTRNLVDITQEMEHEMRYWDLLEREEDNHD